MSTPNIKVGETIPNAEFGWIEYTPELADHSACGIPKKLNTNQWKDKKVVLFSIPGAFTPTCHINHLPPYLKNYNEFKENNVDIIAVISANDPFVMSGWGRVEGVEDKILTLSDTNAAWSAKLGLTLDLSGIQLGIRTGRYAMIIEDLVVKYIGVETGGDVTVSGADAVFAALKATQADQEKIIHKAHSL